MPATTDSCERSCRRSRPRFTAPRNLSRLTSSVERIPSAQSSISSRVSRARRLAHRLLARLLDQPVGLTFRLGEHLLPLLHDPARLLDLLGDRGPHLVED